MGDVLPFIRPQGRVAISRRSCSCQECDQHSNAEKRAAVFEGFIPVVAALRLGVKTQKK